MFARTGVITYKRCSVKTLDYEQGLLDNSTTDIITDANGFTWVSTYTGLQRYNGYLLEKINPVVDNQTIKINYPVYFFGLASGNIWLSYRQGILEYSSVSHSFKNIVKIAGSPSFFSIVPLKETATGTWCLQWNKGIVMYSKTGQIIKNIPIPDPATFNDIISSSNILFRSMICSDDRLIHIRFNESSILQIDTRNEQIHILPFKEGIIYGLACSHDKLYVISDRGLFSSIYGNVSFKNISNPQFPQEKISGGSIYTAANGKLFFSINRHFYQMDPSTGEMQEFTQLNKELILATGAVLKIYTDQFKRIWLLTNNDIKRIQDVNVPFDEFSYPGEKNNFIRSIYFDEQKHFVIAGCYNGTIQLYDTLANPLLQKPVVNSVAGYILSIQKLSQDEYLLYTYGNGLFILNLPKKKIYGLPLLKNVLSDNNFENNTQRINDSTILISTSKNIYDCIVRNGRIISTVPLFHSEQVVNERIGCFIYDAQNTLWAGTLSGSILKLDKAGNLKMFSVPENFVVRSITETNADRIWVGTEQALYVFDTIGDLIKSFTRQNGLLNDCIYSLLPLNKHEVFASSNFGLSYVNEDGTIKNFTKELGLQGNEFNTGAAIKTTSGKLFFGGVNGITAFYPANLSDRGDRPVLNIIHFIVNDSLINPISAAWKEDTITLNYNQNRLQLDFAALGVFDNTDYRYDYRLKGFEESWQHTHQPTGIKYNLSPGTYTLEIRWSSTLSFGGLFEKKLTIIIKPPFWKTWWFEAVAVLTFVALVFFVIRYYNRRRYLLKIKELQSQQKIQLERERISRELHDNIGSQLSFIISNIDWTIDSADNMSKKEEKLRLQSISSTAKNVMSNLRESIWALNKEKITLEEFVDKLKLYIQNIVELKPGLEFISEENIKNNISFSPAETLNIFRICQEVINNVIKHAGATTLKIFIISQGEKRFSITIEDNGKGFDVSGNSNGYGLENIRYRAAEMNLNLDVQSQPAKGTSVSIYK